MSAVFYMKSPIGQKKLRSEGGNLASHVQDYGDQAQAGQTQDGGKRIPTRCTLSHTASFCETQSLLNNSDNGHGRTSAREHRVRKKKKNKHDIIGLTHTIGGLCSSRGVFLDDAEGANIDRCMRLMEQGCQVFSQKPLFSFCVCPP